MLLTQVLVTLSPCMCARLQQCSKLRATFTALRTPMGAFRVIQQIEPSKGDRIMPQGDKSAYTDTQRRQAQQIEAGYKDRGLPEDQAQRRAWATVNKRRAVEKRAERGAATPQTSS